ncbi:MAG: mandelate racemase/muconate lactonizing enzyme family protein, partial [Armatimonadetes bacterium]|nr:mandelate racemase/muconate lactonizing enzyme family protein [Armatimonadota bacterium]
MEIERVEVLALRQRLREPLGNAQRWESSRAALLVKVTTSKGLVGWGECHGSPELCAPIVNDFLGPRVIGQDPLKTAVLWENLYQRGREYGRQGLFLSALSGLDLALWDLKGKALGVSVATLLGGARGPQL